MAERDIQVRPIDSYKGNSKTVSSDKKVEKVIKGTAKLKKKRSKSFGRRFVESLVTTDRETIIDSILDDVVVPYIKTAIRESIDTALDMLFNGDRMERRSSRPKIETYSYRDYSGRSRETRSVRSGYSNRYFIVDPIILDTREDADELLYSMGDMIQQFGRVSVDELYDMIGKVAPYTAEKYGWKDIKDARIRSVADGYLVELSPARVFD